MSDVVTRWVVLETHEVAVSDLDPAGAIAQEAVERWVISALFAYLDRCPRLRGVQAECGAELRYTVAAMPHGSTLGPATAVIVTASATEVGPCSFTISLRIRSHGPGSRNVANARCTIQLRKATTGAIVPIPDEIRDELISVEQLATHLN